jgi:threonylcarbamoyladenosine tRNA methylthiotransferase MtaB
MPTFHIEQFGCRATQADAAVIERQLLDRGYSLAPRERADVIVVNTCTVTAAADAQARDAIRKFSQHNPRARLVVTGCYAQRAPEELAALPGVSWVVGNSHKAELPVVVDGLFSTSRPSTFVSLESLKFSGLATLSESPSILVGDFERKPLDDAPLFGGESNHTRPILKIQDGCNSRCSYCVIPQVRGNSRSLPVERVIQEVNALDSSGTRELVLSGINLGSYGRDLSPRTSLLVLLRQILRETSIERLRVSSIEPMDVTRDLVDFFAANDRMARHFHLPLQSASNRILAAMHRWYRAEHYARRIEIIREQLPSAAIGADVITGFPGETDSEHAETFAFIESLPFSYLHVFSFSKRPGTTAAALPDEVPGEIIKQRARQLRGLGERKAHTFRGAQVGKTMRVLTLRSSDSRQSAISEPEPDSPHCGFTPAISSNYLRVNVPGEFSSNRWLNVRVTGLTSNAVTAELPDSKASVFPRADLSPNLLSKSA